MAEFEYLSRNRYFELYSGVEGKARLNSLRLVQSLHRDLLESPQNAIQIKDIPDQNRIEIRFQVTRDRQNFARFTVLKRDEYRFLRGISEIRPLFESAKFL